MTIDRRIKKSTGRLVRRSTFIITNNAAKQNYD